jgi:arylsulfatase A-like enzyme
MLMLSVPHNVLIFMPDQQRGITTAENHPAKTPHLDRFRKKATRFGNTFAPSPHCCPSRTTFLTSLYPAQHGVWNNICVPNALSRDPLPGTRLWCEDFAKAGYQLDWNGKWHVSRERGPEDYGFDVHSITAGAIRHGQGVMGADWQDYEAMAALTQTPSRAAGEILRDGWFSYTHYGVKENPFGDDDTVDSAIAVIRQRNNSKPWLHYIGTLGPHDPYEVPAEFLALYDLAEIALPPSFEDRMEDKPGLYRRTRSMFDQLSEEEHREAIRHYLAFCSYEDHLFGKVLKALEESGQAENTIVIYVSDHGDYLADHGLWCKGLPCFRGAYEVPLLIHVPGYDAAAGSEIDALVSLADIGPTLLELNSISPDRDLSGRSLVPFLRGIDPTDWRDAIFTQTNGNELYGIQRSVTTNEWKLVYNGFDFDELYDLIKDPHETINLARDPALSSIRRDLYRRLWAFARETGDTAVNNYIMVGLAEFGPAVAFQ